MTDLHVQLETNGAGASTSIEPLEGAAAIAMLESAEITAAKLVPWGSNYTFAVGLVDPDCRSHLGIYKPQAGERPLWDFPHGSLYQREYAAYLLSDWLGWDIVPPTVIRDGPHGPGSLQLYIQPSTDDFDESQFWGRDILEIERLVLFDEISNNADRKIGHCLVDARGRMWGIDHGLTFNVDPKLKTVLWQFSGEAVSDALKEDLTRLVEGMADVRTRLEVALAHDELDALESRIRLFKMSGRHQRLDPHYNVPYGWW